MALKRVPAPTVKDGVPEEFIEDVKAAGVDPDAVEGEEPVELEEGSGLGGIPGLDIVQARDVGATINMMLYGDPGVGKSTLAGSAHEVDWMRPVLHVDIENGALALKRKYPDLHTVRVKTFAQLWKIYVALVKGTTETKYRTVILDNVSESQKLGMDHQFYGEKLSVNFIEFKDATWANGAWNKSSEQMRRLMRAFRELEDINVIFVAWARDFSKPDDPALWKPAFSKTFAGEASGFVDVTGFYYMKQGHRILVCQKDEKIEAKDRNDLLPEKIMDPTMLDIVSYWKD